MSKKLKLKKKKKVLRKSKKEITPEEIYKSKTVELKLESSFEELPPQTDELVVCFDKFFGWHEILQAHILRDHIIEDSTQDYGIRLVHWCFLPKIPTMDA